MPVQVTCNEKNICDCSRIDRLKFNIPLILQKIEKDQIQDSMLLACIYHQIAVEYYSNYNELKSLEYNKKAEIIRSNLTDGLLWRTNLNIGLNYYNINEYKQAIEYFKRAKNVDVKKEADDLITIYRCLAECYMEIGEFDKAVNFARASINIKADQSEINSGKIALATILVNSRDSLNLNEAVKYSQEVYQSEIATQDKEKIQIVLNNLGLAHLNLNKLDSALIYYNNAIMVTSNIDTIYKAMLYINIGVTHFEQKKHNLSIETLNRSLTLFQQYYKTKYHYNYSASFENIADNYTALQQFDTALLYYQKALINLTNNFRTEDIYQNPNPTDSSLFIYSNLDMIRVLHLKATAAFQYYQKNNNPKYLNLANQTYQTAFDFHDKLHKDISTENSRLFQAKNIVPYIENALKVAYELQENGQDISKAAFRFMEKNKATVLLQSMHEADALQFANLPDSLLEQEKDLKIALTFYNKQLNEAIEYEEEEEIDRLKDIIFEEKQKYNQLINHLENNYPNYYRLKYKQNQTQLTAVQNTLDEQSALLEYFVGDSSIYMLLIQKDQAKLYKEIKPANWKSVIDSLRYTLTLPDQTAKANPYTPKIYRQFVQSAHTLFQWLLKNPLDELGDVSHLKIIPDAELNYIPYELLLTEVNKTETVNYKSLPYLFKQLSISYNYSAALMMEQLEKCYSESQKQNMTYGGYAAQYKDVDTVDVDLPKIRQLVHDMSDFFKGKAHLSDAATKQNFLKDTSSYQILHLAMHGKLNDQNPLNSHLVFTKEEPTDNSHNLYAAELYNKKLQTDLAVLSACNTGSGALQKGEGVMSLSRAFTYSGCPSLVMSLWSIPEISSAEVLQSFFKKIKNGKNKDVALQQAKLDYLASASATESHPINWAGLVATGNSEALRFGNNFYQLSFALLLLFGGLFLCIRLFTHGNKLIN